MKTGGIVNRELDLLDLDRNKSKFACEMKKQQLIEELKNEIGDDIKKEIINPDRHNPKRQSIWKKIIKAFNL